MNDFMNLNDIVVSDDSDEEKTETTLDSPEQSMEGRTPATQYINKQRTLVICSRGIGSRERHLMSDILDLLPHSKKDVKLDNKRNLGMVNELAEMKNCNNCIYFELRKRHDLYMWISKTPSGPSIKFQVQNVHTMAELKLTGNCMKGSRPLLSFDKTFSTDPHWQLMKEMLSQTFGSPLGHPKTKPFVDHVFSFSVTDDKIWFRNFQVIYDPDPESSDKDARSTDPILVEIGPRFVLNPVKILSGSFSGAGLFEKKVLSNYAREENKLEEEKNRYLERLKTKGLRKQKLAYSELSGSVLDKVFED